MSVVHKITGKIIEKKIQEGLQPGALRAALEKYCNLLNQDDDTDASMTADAELQALLGDDGNSVIEPVYTGSWVVIGCELDGVKYTIKSAGSSSSGGAQPPASPARPTPTAH